MFNWAIKLGAYSKNLFERALKEPDVNSRLIFLSTAVVTSFLMVGHFVIYAIGFLHGKPIDPNYPTVLGVLGAGHGVNGLARYFTKKNGGDGNGNGNGDGGQPDPPPPPPPPAAPQPVPAAGLPVPGVPVGN
jgi:hypothetical protein